MVGSWFDIEDFVSTNVLDVRDVSFNIHLRPSLTAIHGG